jgi:hypothetical protein
MHILPGVVQLRIQLNRTPLEPKKAMTIFGKASEWND